MLARDRRVPSSYSSRVQLRGLMEQLPSSLNPDSPPSASTVAPTSAEEIHTTFSSTPFTNDCSNAASPAHTPPSSPHLLAQPSRYRASSHPMLHPMEDHHLCATANTFSAAPTFHPSTRGNCSNGMN
eukprot:509011-Pleurochrysis_carterae.AAC.1